MIIFFLGLFVGAEYFYIKFWETHKNFSSYIMCEVAVRIFKMVLANRCNRCSVNRGLLSKKFLYLVENCYRCAGETMRFARSH